MKCSEIKKWISPYLDSELDQTRTFEISQHLESCDSCRVRFEQEQRVESAIRDRLCRKEQVVDWIAVEQGLNQPGQRVLRLRPAWMLAAAACVAFAIIGSGQLSNETLAHPAQWYVEEMHRMQPDCAAFQGTCSVETLQEQISRILGAEFSLPIHNGRLGQHPVELVGVRERKCPGGKQRVEVRLNCCGKPVLLTIGRCHAMGGLEPMRERCDSEGSGVWSSECNASGTEYTVAACRVEGLFVAAVSPGRTHSVTPIVNALSKK
jgi:anti-sigma factor RsiW